MNSEFLEFAFVASVTLESILFAAFGVLYSVYSMHKNSVDKEYPYPPPVVKDLVWLCWGLSISIVIAAALAVTCLFYMELCQTVEQIIRVGLALIVISLAMTSILVNVRMSYPKNMRSPIVG